MKVIDLFAGIGGSSEGAERADCEVVWAGNHWPAAVHWHAVNHPDTVHACQDLQQTDWSTVPSHDLMLASPACQGHSIARGKDKPHHDALRSTAWAVVSAAECHRPAFAIIENVPEFTDWLLYPVWLEALRKLGYCATPHVIDSAYHGVAQHRQRLFLLLNRGETPLRLTMPLRPFKTAREIVDFDEGSWSLVRDKVPNTQARVAAGRKSFGDRFVMPYYGSGSGLTGRSLDRPIGTITTKNRWGVVDGDRMRMLRREESRDFMGFGPHYQMPAGVTEATFMLGNAVVPVVMTDLINELRRHV